MVPERLSKAHCVVAISQISDPSHQAFITLLTQERLPVIGFFADMLTALPELCAETTPSLSSVHWESFFIGLTMRLCRKIDHSHAPIGYTAGSFDDRCGEDTPYPDGT